MWKISVEGEPWSASAVPDPEGTPLEVALQLMDGIRLARVKHLPDSAKVLLKRVTQDKYTPPRCRKPRDRLVETVVASWPLGEFRANPGHGLPFRCRFQLGDIVITPAALEALKTAGQTAACVLKKHAAGDWGEVPPEDVESNEKALAADHPFLISIHRTGHGRKLLTITQPTGADGKIQTTIMLPDEY
jgi:hypothetical protein